MTLRQPKWARFGNWLGGTPFTEYDWPEL